MTARQRVRATALYPPGTVLVPPVGGGQDWRALAVCAQTDPEVFFPEQGGSVRDAKKVCAGCEVRAECLEYALTNDERFGVWGGMSERERRRAQLLRDKPRPAGEKYCPGCDQTKPLDEFHRAAAKPGQRRTYCKVCSQPEKAHARALAKPRKTSGRRLTVSEVAAVRARRDAGETLVEIAADLNVSDSYLQRLLAGVRTPAPDHVPDTTGGAGADPGKVAA